MAPLHINSQNRIKKPLKHLRWSFFQKWFICLRKKLHLRCLIGMWLRLPIVLFYYIKCWHWIFFALVVFILLIRCIGVVFCFQEKLINVERKSLSFSGTCILDNFIEHFICFGFWYERFLIFFLQKNCQCSCLFMFVLLKKIQPTFTCSKSTIETLEKGAKYVQS